MTGIWCLPCSGCVHIRDLQVPRGRSTAVQFASLHQIVEAARYLLSRAPEDGALVTPSLDYAKVLSRKRVGCGLQVAAFPEALTLLELLPGLPLEGTVGRVEPLAIAGPEVGDSLRDRGSMLVAPEQRVAVRPALVHASDEEWDKIGAELLRRGVVVEIDLNEGPVVDGFRILVWVFGVVKSGVRVPLATLVLRLFINAIPSHSLQRPILGDEEKMPVGDEWLYVCLGENEMILWSSDDIFGCFHVFSVPVPWRRWMILSKPIRQPVEGSTDSRGVDHGCGGNAPRDHPSNVRLRRVWLALGVIQMGWLSAVGVVQHLHRRMVTAGVLRRRGSLSRAGAGKAVPSAKAATPFFVVEGVCGQF